MKSNSLSGHIHMRHDTPLPLHAPFWINLLHSPSYVHTYCMAYFSTKRQRRIFEYRIHGNVNIRKKIIYETINDSVG